MIAIVDASRAPSVAAALTAAGLPTRLAGAVSTAARPDAVFVQGAKGADGGSVRLIGRWPD
jgi:phosphoribosylformylglycinamidine cyclo-ligase